ncbi:MAG: hypothetical protein IID28_10770 [Planctomycetes bacterium]|nr:hypothetical protein [Planctomycetota bacterium]
MRPPGQGYLSWIVLVVYFAGAAVANRTVVLCREADGGTSIEIAGDHGQCLGGGGFHSEIDDQPGHTECRASCRDSCPCEDSSLAIEPARVVGIHPDLLPCSAGRPCLHARPIPRGPYQCDTTADVTSRSLRTVVLLL